MRLPLNVAKHNCGAVPATKRGCGLCPPLDVAVGHPCTTPARQLAQDNDISVPIPSKGLPTDSTGNSDLLTIEIVFANISALASSKVKDSIVVSEQKIRVI